MTLLDDWYRGCFFELTPLIVAPHSLPLPSLVPDAAAVHVGVAMLWYPIAPWPPVHPRWQFALVPLQLLTDRSMCQVVLGD